MKKSEIKAKGSEYTTNLQTGEMFVTGSGGGGKGGSAHVATEANNTLRSAAVVKVIEVISEGPIAGICGGARGILINNTPLQNADTTYNFPRVNWDYRVGLPSQSYMAGFASAANEVSVNATLILATPVVRTTTSVNIDSVKVAMLLPQGLTNQNTTNGDLNGSTVSFRIDVKLTSSGSWLLYNNYTINGKTVSPYEAQYRVDRPAGAGLWDIRVTRLTADPTANIKNQTTVARITEIIDVKLGYPDTAVIGLAIDAESVGSSIPIRSYMVKGKIVSVPNNYTEANIAGGTLGTTGTAYSGVWSGVFQQAWTQNPAWVLYDLLTNPRYGMGAYITVSDVDIYSFYDAAVYNDTLVPDGNGGLESRFTFGANLVTQEDAGKLLQLVAGAFRAKLIQINGKWTILQDRPSSPVRNITNSNIIDGQFVYKSTGLFERHTAFNIAWNNRSDRYLQKVSSVEDTVGIARYGYFPIDLAAFGATTEGQAIRMGKWALDSEQNQTETVTFKMGMNGFDLLPNDIFNLFDEDYTGIAGAGRIVSVTGTSVVLDKAVPLTIGSTLSVMLANGTTLESRAIVQTSGTLSSITVASAFSTAVLSRADYVVTTSAAVSRQFKVMNLRFPSDGVVDLECLYHDPSKYSRVELGINIPAPVFSTANAITNSVVLPPTALTFAETAVVNADMTVTRSILASWTAPTLGSFVTGYQVRYSRNGSSSILLDVPTTMVSLPVDADGVYTVNVVAYDGAGRVAGNSLAGTYTIDSNVAGVLGAVGSFFVKGTAALLWNTDDLTVSWLPNGANLTPTQDYLVVVKTAGGVELTREITTDTKYTYTLARNRADNLVLGNIPSSTIQITITPRDLFSRNGATVSATFVNGAPAAVTGLTVFAGTKAATIQWASATDVDVIGYLLWRGTTSTFTPSLSNLVCEGFLNSFTEVNLADSTTYYYKAAAYDIFSRNTAGTGLNISAAASGVTSSGSSINEYQLTGTLFRPNDPSLNSISWTAGTAYQSAGSGAGTTWAVSAGNAAWTSGILYIYYVSGASTLSATTNIVTATAANQVIVATYRGGVNFEAGYGRAYLDGSLVLAGTVAASAIVAGSITATQLAATNLSGIFADLGTITAGNITVNTSGFIRGGQTAYATGTGFHLGYSGAAYKFSIGTGAAGVMSAGLSWDGALLTIAGEVKSLVLASGGNIRSGMTAYATGDGYFLENTAGVTKFAMGSGTAGTLTKGFSYNSSTNVFSVEGELIATGNVLNDAITNAVTSYTQAFTGNLAPPKTFATATIIASLTITTTGKKVVLLASASGQGASTNFALSRDGVQLGGAVTLNASGPVAMNFVDTPVAGTYLYELRLYNGSTTYGAQNRFLMAMEVKK
jgi:hypothetical protein